MKITAWGETIAILNDDVNHIERFLNTGFNELLQLGVLFLFAGGVMLGVSWELALIGILPLPLIVWGSLFYQRMMVMVFDEATSSVDTETEHTIQANLMRITSGKTALIIAHRLSTIRHADRILVFTGRTGHRGRASRRTGCP